MSDLDSPTCVKRNDREPQKVERGLETFYFQKTNLDHNDRVGRLWEVLLYFQKVLVPSLEKKAAGIAVYGGRHQRHARKGRQFNLHQRPDRAR